MNNKYRSPFAEMSLPGDHPGGSLNTTPPVEFLAPRIVPPGPLLDLESDAPLVCPLQTGENGDCEACQ
jgi:hypothetical protein